MLAFVQASSELGRAEGGRGGGGAATGVSLLGSCAN